MPYRRRFSAKMPDYDDDVTVVDVYDLASDIGKECEIIIEKYGPDAVTALLPKVINALELLENLAVRNEKENQALQELTAKISQLENDKIEKAEYRQRFEKEIEAIEEQWRTESAELVTAVGRLQDENKRLRRTINAPGDGTSAPPSPAREHDQEVLSRLTSTAEKQRSTLRHQELQLQEKQQVIDGLTSQVEKLAQVSRDLRRKHKSLQNQMRLVCEERSELTAIMQAQQRDIAALQQVNAQNQKCASCGAATPDGADDEDQSSKPTFSVRELRAILHERNELKLQLNRAEEQLQALRAEPRPDSSSDTSPSMSTTAAEEEEAPVQGPLPAEPDDAPWKRHSGIRKFFRKLFAESDITVGSFPRRSLSSLAGKVAAPGAPPPPPRRRSLPAPHPPAYPPTRTPQSRLDLRQELLNTDAAIEDDWLGHKYEATIFPHEAPLQRSVSLDRGVDVANYLQTLGSDWSGSSVGSMWTVRSDGPEIARSFENLPASPLAVRSRRASLDFGGAFGRSLALSTLRDSYRGIDMGSGGLSPQIKKLKWSFSFTNTFDDFRDDKDDGVNPDVGYSGARKRPLYRSDSTASSQSNESSDVEIYKETKSDRYSPLKEMNRSMSFKNSYDDLKDANTDDGMEMETYLKDISIKTDENFEPDILEMKILPSVIRQMRNDFENSTYRNMSKIDNTVVTRSQKMPTTSAKTNEGNSKRIPSRPKRMGMSRHMSFVGMKRFEMSLRKEVLIRQNMSNCHSCEDILASHEARRRSIEVNSAFVLAKEKIQFGVNKIKMNTPKNPSQGVQTVPMFTDADRSTQAGVANTENVNPTNTSNLVDLSRKCDCQICKEEARDDRKSVIRSTLSNIFMKIVSCRDYGRKLTYWDENNNLNENEMYTCIMHVLKLMLGLWLRHLDHS